MIELQAAVTKALDFVRETFRGENASSPNPLDVSLEAVNLSGGGSVWRVGVGFSVSRRLVSGDASLARPIPLSPHDGFGLHRVVKTIRLDANTGDVLGVCDGAEAAPEHKEQGSVAAAIAAAPETLGAFRGTIYDPGSRKDQVPACSTSGEGKIDAGSGD